MLRMFDDQRAPINERWSTSAGQPTRSTNLGQPALVNEFAHVLIGANFASIGAAAEAPYSNRRLKHLTVTGG
jgi:hypothetical protein